MEIKSQPWKGTESCAKCWRGSAVILGDLAWPVSASSQGSCGQNFLRCNPFIMSLFAGLTHLSAPRLSPVQFFFAQQCKNLCQCVTLFLFTFTLWECVKIPEATFRGKWKQVKGQTNVPTLTSWNPMDGLECKQDSCSKPDSVSRKNYFKSF